MVSADDIRLHTLLTLTRDAVLSARACLARSVLSVRPLARTATRAARGAFSNHIITLLALNSKLRVRRASAIHTCGALGVRLLTRGTCRARLVIGAHDIRRHTILALTRDAVLCAIAWHAFSLRGIRL